MHQRAGSEAIRSMIGKISLADREETRNSGHQIIVHPQPAHGVVNGRVDPHRHLVWILSGDPFVHLEEVSIALANNWSAQTLDRIGKIQVHAQTCFTDSAAFVANRLGIS